MRKVNKRDEIASKFIESDGIERRFAQFNKRHVSEKTQKKVGKLPVWLESLKGKNISLHVIMNRIYNDIDYFMENEIADYLVCVKGCAHCCKIPVQVSLMEMDYIAQRTGTTIRRIEKSRYEMPQRVATYCPLLDKDTATCSVYKYRPLACRLFGTFDHWKYCEQPDKSHYIHSFANQPLFNTLHEFLMFHSDSAGKEIGVAAVAEIRDWIKQEEIK